MLNILSGLGLSELDPHGALRHHLEIEASRLAFKARDRYIADPRRADVPLRTLLSAEFADDLRSRILMERATQEEETGTGFIYRDTVYIAVVDCDLTAVSFINSLYLPFGSGITTAKTGIILHNRGSGFVVEPGHPNCVEPRKRPLHTIIPGLVRRNSRCELVYGVMGGGYQPVGHVHLLTNLFDFGMDLQEAIDCERTYHVAGQVEAENAVSDTVVEALRALGHKVVRPEMPWGGAQAIRIDWENGTLAAGSDPRKDGCALGY